MYIDLIWLASWTQGVWGWPHVYFPFIIDTKQLLLVTFCDTAVGIGAKFWTHAQKEERWRMEGQADMEVEIVT